MSQKRLAPQQPEECLIPSRMSSRKGGTLIAGQVWTPQEHCKQLADLDLGYRRGLGGCPSCGHPTLHVHDYRERQALQMLLVVVVTVVRFICANPQCKATWQVLPAFVARYLHWTWPAVEHTTETGPASAPSASIAPSVQKTVAEPAAPGERPTARIPSRRTVQRWTARLRASASQLVALLAARGGQLARAVAHALPEGCARAQVVSGYAQALGVEPGRRYGVVAALLHALQPGIRLM